MKAIRIVTTILALIAWLCTIGGAPFSVKGRDWKNPRLDSYHVSIDPIWDPPSSEAPVSLRLDILGIEWLVIGGITFLVFRVTRQKTS